MIEIPRPPFDFTRRRIKVFGLGGAGCNVLDRIVLDGPPEGDFVAINTDAQSLAGSVAEEKVQIGQTITRGLGAGGDPEVGRTAAEEGIGEILAALADATMVFLVVGLGGGTGSGAAPVIAEIAREHNAMVVVIATLPFGFEGKRRTAQALDALSAIHRSADIVICFENDRMGEAVSPKAGIQEAFAAADGAIAQSVRALVGMAGRTGPVHAGLDEIASAVCGLNARCLFGFGTAEGDNRAHRALDAALKNPLLDRGRRLHEAKAAVIQVAGGADLTLNEVQILMDEVNKQIRDETRLFFGAAVDPKLSGRLMVTIVSATPGDDLEAGGQSVAREAAQLPAPVDEGLEAGPDEEFAEGLDGASDDEVSGAAPTVRREPSPPPKAEPPRAPVEAPRSFFGANRRGRPQGATAASSREQKAEQMQFEPLNRGRFEKSEPTIVDGQDLDVPTFLRRNGRPK